MKLIRYMRMMKFCIHNSHAEVFKTDFIRNLQEKKQKKKKEKKKENQQDLCRDN